MAYITASDVRAIRNELKAKYGDRFKFSVRKSNNMAVYVTILSGDLSFADVVCDHGHGGINQYYLDRYLNCELFTEIYSIMREAPARAGGTKWYNNTDIQVDYFDVAYYMDLYVGSYDQSYVAKIAA